MYRLYMKQYIAIDIGGTAVKGGLIDNQFNIVHRVKLDVANDYNPSLIQTTRLCLRAIVDYCQLHNLLPVGIALSVTGDIDTQCNTIVGSCGNIPDWNNIDLNQALGDISSLPISVVNDANAACLAEWKHGNGKGCNNIIVYTVGTGIGGGIIANGKLLNGSCGFAGNIGHMIIDSTSTTKCTCGNNGCFESLASTKALLNQAQQLGFVGDGQQLLEKCHNGQYQGLLDNFLHWHGIAIANMIHIFNPQRIIIGGGISAQGQWLIDAIAHQAQLYTLPHYYNKTKILPAKLANDAGLIGAVQYFEDTK